MNELISVIVPIYNVEDYLCKCLDSIINQTYNNLEIILIDDVSTDKCDMICDEYKIIDSRIRVFHKENDGLSSARNYGLDICNGKYICFVDSDDYIEYNMVEELYNNMMEFDSDISICNYNYSYNNGVVNKFDILKFCVKCIDKFNNLENEYSSMTIYAWNKLYKREIFDDIRYPLGRLYEDNYIITEVLDRANKISYITKPLYNYLYREGSIVNSFSKKHYDRIIAYDKRIEFYHNKNYYDLELHAMNKKVNVLIDNIIKMYVYKIKNDELMDKYYTELVNTCNEIPWSSSYKNTKYYKMFSKLYMFYKYARTKSVSFIKRNDILYK